jgi:hypothetical protein
LKFVKYSSRSSCVGAGNSQGLAKYPAVAVVGSASYLSYNALKAVFDWGEDLIDDIKQTEQTFQDREDIVGGIGVPVPIRAWLKIKKWTFG